MVLSGKPADWEDVSLMSQNSHLIGVWMPISFIEGKREAEFLRGTEVKRQNREGEAMRKWSKKGHQSGENVSGKGPHGEAMCSSLLSGSHTQVDGVRWSLCELNKGTLVKRTGRGAGFSDTENHYSLCMISAGGGGLVAQLCPTLCNPMDCSLPVSSVHGISQEEYWSGLPVSSPADLPDGGRESRSPALQADSLLRHQESSYCVIIITKAKKRKSKNRSNMESDFGSPLQPK